MRPELTTSLRIHVAFDGNIKRIIHHINDLQGVHHLTIECTTPDQASELVALQDLREDFEIGFGALGDESVSDSCDLKLR